MLKNCGGNKKYNNVLVPMAGGPNSLLALEIASILTEKDTGTITAFTVASRKRKFDIIAFVDQHAEGLGIPRDRIHCKTVTGKDVVRAVLRRAEKYDLVVLGNTRESALRQMAHTPIPETIVRKCEKPLVMCRAISGVQSWIRRYF